MDILMDSVKVIFRIITILPLMLAIVLYMGKRSIGELPVFDFLVILVFGAVVGADIADPKINHFHTVVAMIIIALLQKLIIYLKLKHQKVGKLLTFEPTVVLYQGVFLKENMKQIKYSIDNILQMLREDGVFHTKDVELAIVEANGKLSVKLYSDKEAVIREDLSIHKSDNQFEFPVVLDGIVQTDLLHHMDKSEAWLMAELEKIGESNVSSFFYIGLNTKNELIMSKKHTVKTKNVPPFYH
ncbi:DUF421 domain-containing protein [Guptibacillus hwajinpoensis]|uniref:DUF421 domain-containing protein n=1 Tax=Guptibacillus hwajinpoensis TaxID=208199 RepID=A0A0J6CZI1_9BACL|nr:DUF421 domain-containing protein [Alkalihalobacillus macyae]KMM38503.1 hypothetical protein AB986_04180 [Alkalihalobacillus macyae]